MKIKVMWTPTGKTAGLNVCLVGHVLWFLLLYSFMFDDVTTASLYFIICVVIGEVLRNFLPLYIYRLSAVARWFQRGNSNFSLPWVYLPYCLNTEDNTAGAWKPEGRHEAKGKSKEFWLYVLLKALPGNESNTGITKVYKKKLCMFICMHTNIQTRWNS